MPEALPLGELLAVLRQRGLPIGVREHLTVSRLLQGWQGTDPAGLQAALAAVLARNPEEVRLVRETFDELYGPRPRQESPLSPQPGPRPPVPRRWGRVAGLLLASSLIASSLGKEQPPPVEVPPAPQPETALQGDPPPPPPEISETFEQADLRRAGERAAGVALFVLLWLYGTRLRREANGLARGLWRRQLDDLPRPYSYKLALGQLAPALPAAALDQAARLLGRAPAPPRADDLDVDGSLESTLRAGLAPQIVLRERSSPQELLVLQDTAGEMHPWRRSMNALLAGLAARGVSLDIWLFHADAGRVFRSPGRETVNLERLARLRAGLPLLVISTGEGLPSGQEGRIAAWAAILTSWDRRAWIHPVTDAAYWRPQLRQVGTEVWPLTPGGVIAAAHHLAAFPAPLRARYPIFPDRPVAPLDVDRLRWLLFLAPQRDPDLLELLRQRFFPRLPSAALLEALESPPLARQPGSRPPLEEVHAFLADLLAASQPETASAAHARWRLDRALQEAGVPIRREKGLLQLEILADGPMAGEVERAARRLPYGPRKRLLKEIGKRAMKDGLAAGAGKGRRRWRLPDGFELCASLLCGLLLTWGLGLWLVESKPVELLTLYKLEAVDPSGRGPVYLRVTRSPRAPATAALYRQDRNLEVLRLPEEVAGVTLEPADRGRWYYLRAWMGSDRDRLAISNSVWVRPEASNGSTATPEAVPLAETPDTATLSTEMAPEPMVTDEPLSTDLVETHVGPSAPTIEDEGTRFGTVTSLGTTGGAPIQPIEDASTQAGPGTLEITGYPDDLPPQMLHIIGPGMPREGAPWNGGILKLEPGEYLPVVHTPTRSIGLTRVTIQAGSAARISVSEREIRTIDESLVETTTGEEGPKITSVTSGNPYVALSGRPIDVVIHGEQFDPNAKVSFSLLDPVVDLESCEVKIKEILCSFFIMAELSSSLGSGGIPTKVKIVNPDGRYAVHEVYVDFLRRRYF